ncbi:N-acetylmuramoyl-L-alanine amidase family protein [Clostridium uliginosum]|uniref:Putative cell wall binding repeat-containing protein n=1 Tax=Clostridium uliginosum TaxID=119641 RepID=A0A1I1PDN7_9CLOT|nr:N-acetylmuramoyl-L-alanine amidase family protein [Clostridium uliginosum]SFD08014.1 Putative cell wall binding repeat-containing protein [Clostridium uliginosum]
MIKRANKITAGLVAAAAVISLVPATGVNAADYKRIESKDGTVYNIQAYKDGTFVIDGDVVKEDNDEIYYLKDGKYTPLEDLDSGDDFDGIKSQKYLKIQDGDYFVDLTNGKVTDDNIQEDNAEDAGTDLKKKIKKDTDGRYSEKSEEYKIAGDLAYGSEAFPKLDGKEIAGNKYGETWYQVKYASKGIEIEGTGDSAKIKKGTFYNVYTDAKGKYIDADYNIGKIKVQTTTGNGATVTLKNTDTDKLFKDDDIQVSISNAKTIAQDSNNIYRRANIIVTSVDNIEKINGTKLDATNSITTTAAAKVTVDGSLDGAEDGYTFTKRDGKATLGEYKGCNTVEFKVIQKISKAQASDDADGAKYAKTVTTYIVSDDEGKKDEIEDSLKNSTDLAYSVVNGKLIAYSKNAHEIQTIELKSKSSYYYTDIQKDCDDEIEGIDTDVDGNVWRVDGGFVYKWDNDEDWDKVYKVDGLMSHLSVYNKDNMAVWSDDDDEVYSIIGNKDKEDEKPVTDAKGWAQATDGTWTYVNEDGTKATGWLNLGGTWYYMNDDGKMATGWKNVNGIWYYLNPISDGTRGAMKTGWINDNGTWYYTNASGCMQTGWVPVNGAWYYMQPWGGMKTGWLNDYGTWYYLNSWGGMATNTTVDGCTLAANGAWVR